MGGHPKKIPFLWMLSNVHSPFWSVFSPFWFQSTPRVLFLLHFRESHLFPAQKGLKYTVSKTNKDPQALR